MIICIITCKSPWKLESRMNVDYLLIFSIWFGIHINRGKREKNHRLSHHNIYCLETYSFQIITKSHLINAILLVWINDWVMSFDQMRDELYKPRQNAPATIKIKWFRPFTSHLISKTMIVTDPLITLK